MSRYFDAIIIGTGQAGPSLAARFAAAGMTVAIIERHKFGGTCVNTGCIPTKTLVASAYAAHVARRGAEYGFVGNGDVRVDMKRVKARKDEVSGRSNKGVEEWLRGLKNCTVIQGHARFQSSHTVVVNDEVLRADKVFINVGGRAGAVLAVRAVVDDDHVVVAYLGSSVPACSATMYSAYQSDQLASRCPVRFSCSPCAASARRRAFAKSAADAKAV